VLSSSRHTLILIIAAVTIVTAGVVSYFASSHPDALEHSLESYRPESQTAEAPSPTGASSDSSYSGAMPDYSMPGLKSRFGSNAATGIAGAAVVFAVITAIGLVLRRRRGRQAHG
jgi:hypothetical protein